MIAVQEHISNAHGIDDPYSLFGHLDNVRLAYVIGADLAAIAMCRTVTEILIRRHYDNGEGAQMRLSKLIERTQSLDNFKFLRGYNLVAKVREANDILHFNRDDIKHPERSRALVRDWVMVLREMIERAATPSAYQP